MKPNTLVIRLGGPPGSGKSTVADSFATGRLRGLFRWESQADEGDRNPDQRTKGVRLVDIINSESVNIVMIDLGGHGQYFMTHQALISVDRMPVISAIVLSSLTEPKQLEFDALEWASFFACRVQPGSSLQPLMLFGTRADRATPEQQTALTHVFHKVKTEFSRYFTFPCKPFLLDARKSYSGKIVDLRTTISNLTQEVLNAAALQPSVCELLQEVLPVVSQTTAKPLVTKTEFLDHVVAVLRQRNMKWRNYSADIITASLTMRVLDWSLEYMTRQGKVVAFKKVSLNEFVVIKPAWIYTALVGLLMSEHPLPEPYVKYKNGYAKLSDVIALLRTAHPEVSGERAVEILSELGFVIVFEDKALVPVKLEVERPEEQWPRIPRAMIAEMVFAGRRTRYIGIVAWSAALFPLTQSHFYHLFVEVEGTELPLWAGGIRVCSGKYPGAIGIVEARSNLRCIDVIVRGEAIHADECHRLLHNLCDEVTALVIAHSPGCTIEYLYLSSKELAMLSELALLSAPKVAYTDRRVRQALEAGEHVTDGEGSPPEDPHRLMLSDDEWSRCGPAMPDDSSGRALKKGDIELHRISRDVAFDMSGLKHFASRLLRGSGCAMTAEVFLNSLDPHEYTTVPARMSVLLSYWIGAAPEPTYTRHGGQLMAILLRVGKSAVARTYKGYLMGE